MKTRLNKILSVFLVLVMLLSALPFTASAATYSGTCGDNLTWTFDDSTGALSITGTGAMYDYSYGNRPWESYEDDIKSVVIGNSVTTIGDDAFYDCDSLTSVTIPDSVTTIGSYAFSNCDGLKSITIPDSVTTIGDSAFAHCYSLTSVTIPDSVTTIGSSAFSGCNRVFFDLEKDSYAETYAKNNSIPYFCIYDGSEDKIISVTVTSKLSFEINKETYTMTINCNGNMLSFVNEDAPWVQYKPYIKNIIINDGCTSISANAFKNFQGIRSVTIPDSVTTIGGSAFEYCDSLTSITIPDSVTTIGEGAFDSCSGLTSVAIGDSVTTIGEKAFYDCSGIKELTIPVSAKIYNSSNTFYNCTNIEKVIFTKGNGTVQNCDTSTFLGSNTYYGYTPWYNSREKCTEIIIEDGVTGIGSCTFYNCTSLTSVTIPDSVTTIGNYAFYDCDSLTSVTIGNSVTSIGNYAFYSCDSLTSVTIPDSVTTIGYYAFEYCYSLTSVAIGNSVATIRDYAFAYCNSLTSVTIPDSVTTIGSSAFSGCNRVVFDLEKDSYAETYAKNNSIPYIYIYDGSEDKIISVTVTSKLSFEINKETNTMTINCNGNMLSFVNEDAPWVQYKPYIKNIIINDGCTSISANAFKNFQGIRSVTIPDSVTTIGSYAFYDCTGLTGVTIPDSVTTIGDYAFSSCDSLTSVAIPDSVTTIGSYAFSSCDSLTSVTISDSVTSIGNYAFSSCTSLTSVKIGNSVTTIGNSAFRDCTGLTSVTIPDSVTTIGWYAFYDCDSLTSVTMPVSASIGSYAFSGCNEVKKVTLTKGKGTFQNYTSSSCTDTPWYESTTDSLEVIIEGGVTGIGSYMFYGCENLGSLTLPESVKSIGSYAFNGCQKMEKLKVYNRNCTFGTEATSYYTTIVGYAGSTAEAYANEMGFDFELIEPCDHKNYHTERDEPTCTEEGLEKSVCDDCGSTFYYAELPKTGHTLETVVANPTCQSAGMVAYYCKVCKYSYIAEITDPVDHDMSWVVVSKPTSSADGEMHYKCSYCDLVEQTKVVPAFMIASNSIANINFETNTISGFDAGATSIDDYVTVETDGYSFVCDSDVIGKGTVIELTDGEVVVEEFTAVVFGDVNGDGWYDGTDSIIVSCLANGMLSKDDVSPAFYEAADCNHDGTIDAFDVALLEKAGMLLADVDQSESAEELALNEAYIEYLDLIDQTPEIEAQEETPEAEVITPEQGDAEIRVIDKIINLIKSIIEMLLSYIPMPLK